MNLFALSIIARRGKKKKGKAKENAKDDLMVNGNDIYSHFNDVLNVNKAKIMLSANGNITPSWD